MPEDVAIVGSGLVGSAWALVFARAGSRVRLYDQEASQLAAAEARIAANAREMVRHGLLDDAPTVLARIESRAGLADALEGVSYVQESVFEDADVKRAFYRRLDAAVGSETIIGSSSSGIPSSVFTEGLACAPRCLIAHPINPPYVIPLVEICPSPWTDPSVVDRVWSLMSDAGMAPVRVTREIDGFIANRLQAALLWEAFRLLEGGYATAQDIDRTISAGLGRRWAFIGPFETIDLNAPRGWRLRGPPGARLLRVRQAGRAGGAVVGRRDFQGPRRVPEPGGGIRVAGASGLARPAPHGPGRAPEPGAQRARFLTSRRWREAHAARLRGGELAC